MKWIGDLEMEKVFFKYHLNSYGRFKLMTCSNSCRDKMIVAASKEVFCCEQKSRFISRRLTLEKSLRTFLIEYMLAV